MIEKKHRSFSLMNDDVTDDTQQYHNPNPKSITDINSCTRDKFGDTPAMFQARNHLTPYECYQHCPQYRDAHDNTVAMILAKGRHLPSQFWEHTSDLINDEGNTVAMLMAQHGICPPEQWRHHVNLKNKNDETVMSILAQFDCVIPRQWQEDYKRVWCDEVDGDGNICCVCLEEIFIRIDTVCKHVICTKCSEKYFKNLCPYCGMKGFRMLK